jgi:hypothetical protein
MTTANLKLPEIAESQSGKATTHNEALHVVDALLNCGVIDRDLTAPPGSPVDGDVYIPKATATGAWAGHENHLAQWDVSAWKFHVPEEGWTCYVRDEDKLLVYTGSVWALLAGSGAGSVTSVALSMPSELSVSGSPITSSGTLAVTKAVQNANKVFAGPTTGADAAPAFRALVAADQVTMVGDSGSGGTKGVAPAPAAGDAAAGKFLKADGTWATVSGASGGTVTSVAFTAPAEFSVSGSPITSSGTIAVTKANQSANQVFAGPTSGGAAAPAFRALVAADMVYRNLVMEQIVFGFTTDVTTGDGAGYMVVPSPMNGLNLVRVHARVITAGTTGTTDIQIHNVTDAVDMLSTKITIDSGETGSDTAATAAVINTSADDVATNDLLRIDIDATSTTKAKGCIITLEFA